MITIHNFARGARGLRVFWQCEEMGLPYRMETVSYPPSEAFRALHPLGSVPFLEDDGVAMGESVAMMLYLAQKYGPTPLLPADATLGRVLHMTVFGEATLGAGINVLLTAHFGAPEADKENWSARAQAGRIEEAIAYVASLLADHPYLAGDHFTLADISVSCALGMWKGALGRPLPEPIVSWRERLAARPAYARAQQTQAAR